MTATTNLLTRQDTLLGVCQGLGEDFGFNANYLRIALGSVLLFSPTAAIGAYLVFGIALMVGRWWWPVAVADDAAPVAAPAPVIADNDEGARLANAA